MKCTLFFFFFSRLFFTSSETRLALSPRAAERAEAASALMAISNRGADEGERERGEREVKVSSETK